MELLDADSGYFSPLYWREVKTPAHPRHCRDTSQVKPRHVSPAIPPLSPVPGGGIQMTGTLLNILLVL